jgi:hypothetical protein
MFASTETDVSCSLPPPILRANVAIEDIYKYFFLLFITFEL